MSGVHARGAGRVVIRTAAIGDARQAERNCGLVRGLELGGGRDLGNKGHHFSRLRRIGQYRRRKCGLDNLGTATRKIIGAVSGDQTGTRVCWVIAFDHPALVAAGAIISISRRTEVLHGPGPDRSVHDRGGRIMAIIAGNGLVRMVITDDVVFQPRPAGAVTAGAGDPCLRGVGMRVERSGKRPIIPGWVGTRRWSQRHGGRWCADATDIDSGAIIGGRALGGPSGPRTSAAPSVICRRGIDRAGGPGRA